MNEWAHDKIKQITNEMKWKWILEKNLFFHNYAELVRLYP